MGVIFSIPPTLAQILAKFTGTPDGTKFLRDDGSWQAPSGSVSLSNITAGTLATTLALGSQVITSTDNTTWYNATGKYIKLGVVNPVLALGTSAGTQGDTRWALGRYAAGTYDSSKSGLYSSNGQDLLANAASSYFHVWLVGGAYSSAIGFGSGTSAAAAWCIGQYDSIPGADGTKPGLATSGTDVKYNVPSTYAHKLMFAGTEKYRFAAALAEMDRLSLGGTIGSSVDPGAGGLALTGNLLFSTSSSIKGTTGLKIFGDGGSATTGFASIAGAYDLTTSTGAQIYVFGVTNATYPGAVRYFTGATGANAKHYFYDKTTAVQLQIDETGCVMDSVYTAKFGLSVTPIVQRGGGVATAGGTYTAAEQSMLQQLWNALRAFGFLS